MYYVPSDALGAEGRISRVVNALKRQAHGEAEEFIVARFSRASINRRGATSRNFNECAITKYAARN